MNAISYFNVEGFSLGAYYYNTGMFANSLSDPPNSVVRGQAGS